MKKLVSLLLAGLLGLSMASAAMAVPVTEGNKLPVETIYSGITGINGIYFPIFDFKPLDPPTADDDVIDPEFSVPSSDSVYWYGAVTCPVKNCNTMCNAYMLPTTSGTQVLAYCPTHGFQRVEVDADEDAPTVADTYTVTAYAAIGGSVLLDGSANLEPKTVKPGGIVMVSIVPDYGYDIAAVYVNGYNVGAKEAFQLNGIYHDYSIRAVFKKVDITRPYTITVDSTDNGSVYATVNGSSVGAISSLTGTYADVVNLHFVPAEGNYIVENVTINGVSMGNLSYYNVGRMRADLKVSVTFAWDSPYTDLDKVHVDAVEYVTEIDVMGSPNKNINTDKFMGKSNVPVRSMACYLAELADVDDKLNTVAERVAWATEKGLISDTENLNGYATWARACDMTSAFVRTLEKDGNITFKDLENAATAYDVAAAMDLVTEAAYKADGKITRYDMAEICYAVSLLETK